MDIGDKIKILREKQGLTQAQLGSILGVSGEQVRKYEKGINQISIPVLLKLCDLFNIHPSHFVPEFAGGYDEPGFCSIKIRSALLEVIQEAIEVLESNTIEKYAESLSSNIHTFHAGIKTRLRMDEFERRLSLVEHVRKSNEASTEPTLVPMRPKRK